jgi:hypothetical protein
VRCWALNGYDTNHELAALNKNRWHVEPLLKWIKPHPRIKKLLATRRSAATMQVWSVVFPNVLIAIVKKELQLNAALYKLPQIPSASVFEKAQTSCTFRFNVNT